MLRVVSWKSITRQQIIIHCACISLTWKQLIETIILRKGNWKFVNFNIPLSCIFEMYFHKNLGATDITHLFCDTYLLFQLITKANPDSQANQRYQTIFFFYRKNIDFLFHCYVWADEGRWIPSVWDIYINVCACIYMYILYSSYIIHT